MDNHQNTESQEWDDDSVGTSQEELDSTLEENPELISGADDNEDAQDANLHKSVKTQEELRLERAEAIREAQKNKAHEREARAQADFYKTALKVGKNPAKLKGLYRDDPELAEQIAQEVWETSYDEVVSTLLGGQRGETASMDEDSIRSLLRDELNKTERQNESKKMKDLIIDFTLEHDISPKSATYQKIMEKYETYNPKNYQQAKDLLEMSYVYVTGNTPVPNKKNISAATIPVNKGGFVPQKPMKRNVSASTASYLTEKYGKEKADKFLRGQ